jgi:dihydroorotate dehydrogenase
MWPLLFRADPESVHGLAIRAAELASSSRWLCSGVERLHATNSERLAVEIAGLHFRTPLGLAAGFDKSARAVPLLVALGFRAYRGRIDFGRGVIRGNPNPRLFRIPQDRDIVNYGLPNDGSDRVAQRLAGLRACAPLGINIADALDGGVAKGRKKIPNPYWVPFASFAILCVLCVRMF